MGGIQLDQYTLSTKNRFSLDWNCGCDHSSNHNKMFPVSFSLPFFSHIVVLTVTNTGKIYSFISPSIIPRNITAKLSSPYKCLQIICRGDMGK